MSRPIQSVQRAFELLECLARHGRPCGVRALARELGLTPPTTLSLLKTMGASGYVCYHSEQRQYSLGEGLIRLSRNINEGRQLEAIITPTLDQLHRDVGETTLGVGLDEAKPTILYHRRSPHALAVHHENPSAILNRLATVHALVAFQAPGTAGRIATELELKPGERKDFEARVRKAAQMGYAEVVNQKDSGIAALALPVLEADGCCRVAIGLSLPIHRYSPQTREALLSALQASTRKLQELLAPGTIT